VEEEEAVAVTGEPERGPEAATSIAAMLFAQVERHGAETILRRKDRGIWKSTSWAELGTLARRNAMGLKAVGHRKGEVACILADTSPAWVTTDLGILSAGGISAGIYTTDTIERVKFVINDSGCRIVFVGNEEHLDKVLEVRGACPGLERIVIFDMKGLRDFSDPMAESLQAFLARGERYAADHAADWAQDISAIRPDDGALLSYTSGTTGTPKGVLLSHRNILFQVAQATRLLEQRTGDERVAFLPMPHFMERVLGLYQSLYSRTISNYVESAEALRENLQEVMPTVLCAPPRVWERLYSRVAVAIADATWIQRRAYDWALLASSRAAAARARGKASPLQRAMAAIGSFLILRKVRRIVGLDRVRVGCIGGAPVSAGLMGWYAALGIDLVEFYGLSECAGLTIAIAPGRWRGQDGRYASVGEVKLSEAGEILLRGEHIFAGYWRPGASPQRSLAAGWFPTGDTARMEDGTLRITGRVVDRITTKSGRTVTPSEVEMELKFSPYIADALIVGHQREFLGCLVMIDHENVEKWAQDKKIAFAGLGNLAQIEAVRQLIDAEIRRANAKLADPIGSFRLIERRLEPEDPELTPLLKLRRGFVSEKYRGLIEEMYGA
jgi:long-chain acyl-CoA synthetase